MTTPTSPAPPARSSVSSGAGSPAAGSLPTSCSAGFTRCGVRPAAGARRAPPGCGAWSMLADDLGVCDVVVLCQPAPHARTGRAAPRAGHAGGLASATTSTTCRALLALDDRCRCATTPRWWSARAWRPGCRACWPATWPRNCTRSTNCTSPSTAPPARRAPASTTTRSATRRWAGTTASGSSRPVAAAATWCGSPSRWRRTTATAPRSATRCCCTARFPRPARISARVSATRRDRLTARLPMLHPAARHGRPRRGARRGPRRGRRRRPGHGHRRRRRPHRPTSPRPCARPRCCRCSPHGLAAGCAHARRRRRWTPLDLLHHATVLGVRVQEFTGVARATSW